MSAQKSSTEHCRSYVTMMRMAGLKGQPTVEKDVTGQTDLFAHMLTRFSPEAVRVACSEWAETQERWPALSVLLKVVGETDAALSRQATIQGTGASAETWPARMERLLGAEITKVTAANIRAVMSLRDDAHAWDDAAVEQELRWCINHGYRWRPERGPLDNAAVSRTMETMNQIRRAPWRYGGEAAAEALCRMGEMMITEVPEIP